MRTFVFATVALVLSYGVAFAVSPCCAPKPCPDGKYAKKNDVPGQAECCSTDAQGTETCTPTAYAGYACDNPLDGPVEYFEDLSRKPVTGCLEVSDDTCIGGDLTAVRGCTMVGGTSTADVIGGDCNTLAVAACCDVGSCH